MARGPPQIHVNKTTNAKVFSDTSACHAKADTLMKETKRHSIFIDYDKRSIVARVANTNKAST